MPAIVSQHFASTVLPLPQPPITQAFTPSDMNTFSWIFLAALLLGSLLRLWLAQRHAAHVLAHRAAVPEAFASRISLADHQRAADYTITKARLSMLDTLLGAAVLLGFTLAGGLQWLSEFWSQNFPELTPNGSLWHGVALILSLGFISSAIDMPLSLYRTFVIEQRFGFNRMTWQLFVADLCKQTLLGLLLGVPLILCVLWLMQQSGELWWLHAWLVWSGFNLLMIAVYPTLIAPWFNRFSPLDDESLRSRLQALLDKCHFRARGLFVMDGSRRSSHGNAYFTGFGAARRIVLFDTLISRLTPAELEAVLAHELGHFHHRHILKRMVVLFALSLGFLALLGWTAQQPWFHVGLGVSTVSDAMSLLLFFMAVPCFTFLLQPLASLSSRKHEYQADAYAAQQAQRDDLISALVKLYQDNAATLTPDPLHSTFYDSHPPAALRIAHLQNLPQVTVTA